MHSPGKNRRHTISGEMVKSSGKKKHLNVSTSPANKELETLDDFMNTSSDDDFTTTGNQKSLSTMLKKGKKKNKFKSPPAKPATDFGNLFR